MVWLRWPRRRATGTDRPAGGSLPA